MQGTITTRYFRTTVVILLSGILLLGLTLMLFASYYFRSDMERELIGNLDNAAMSLEYSMQRYGVINRTAVEKDFETIVSSNDSILFLVDASGRTQICSEPYPCRHVTFMIPPNAMNQAISTGSFTEMGTLSGLYNTSYYTIGRKVVSADGDLIGVLYASTNAAALSVFLNDMMFMFIISAGVMIFVSSILSVLLTQRMTTPLRNMTEAVNNYAMGDFSSRVQAEGDDEITQLALTFNNMAQALQKNEEMRSTFIDNVAHELRTPMTSIKGFVDGILDQTIPPEQQGSYLKIVSDEVGRLSRLTRSMLDIAKLENGENDQNAKVYDIWETITLTIFGAEKRIEEKNIRIEGFAPKRTLVYADPDIIHQVVFNLIDNAVKFAGDNGVITLNVTKKQNFIYVSIKNTGEGIPKEDIPHIFERFYKADKSRSVNTEGAGLGLYICKRLINRSGGDIMVRSVMDEYTEFVFHVPAGKEEKQKSAKEVEV
jgi:Signal transduction histidine kinase